MIYKLGRVTIILVLMLVISSVGVFAEDESPSREYAHIETITLEDGTSLERITISGPPKPPPGYEHERQPVDVSELNNPNATTVLTVPAFDWVFGCSSVSGAMIAGYYDRNGYPNMYTGPANGGVMPMDNSTTYWPTWSDGDETYPNLPLAASHDGVDGWSGRGSIDNYWVQYGSAADDPYVTNGWAEHTWGNAIGDYMKTSQSAFSNTDGSTHFYNYTSSSAPLTCADMASGGVDHLDGTYGRKLFYEARGYTVTDCYNQKTDNNGGGFTFAMYKAEIDAGHPVMINVVGHTMVGVGYNDTGNTVYLHDTWDYDNHSMTWGGSYQGMEMQSVSIVHLAAVTTHQVYIPLVLKNYPSTEPVPGDFNKTAPTNGAADQSINPTLSWGSSSDATSYEYCVDTSNNNACDASWTSTGTNTSVGLSGLTNSTTYYWQVRAKNSSGTVYANGSETSYWSFTTEDASACTPDPPGESDNIDDSIIICSGQVVTGQVSQGDRDDVYKIYILDGKQVTIVLSGSGGDADLYLYLPNATDVNTDSPAAGSFNDGNDELIQGIVSGGDAYWYVDVYSYAGTTDYTLTVTISDPASSPHPQLVFDASLEGDFRIKRK